MSKTKRNPFPYWLVLFLFALLLQATSFLTGLYFLAENLRNGNRWIPFISIALINLLFLCIVSFLNQKMSVGILGSSMQRLRTARFTAAFLTVMVTSLLLALASLIYALIKGPDPAASYLTYTSFFKSNEDLGKVLFAGTFSSAVLAFDHRDWRRYPFVLLGIGFLVMTGLLGLTITFWGLVMASFVVGIYVLLDRKAKSPLLRIGALIYVLLIVVLVFLVAIPSSLADTLRVYFGNELAFLLKTRVKLWGNYLNSLSSWRIFIGDGPIGYYRVGVDEGSPLFTPLQNGILEVYNSGGLVYLMFYFLVVIVGLFRFKKSEEKNPTFFAIVLAFTCAFLLFTIISDERLFFSSRFLSFFVAYIFMCYPHNKDRLMDET